MEWVRLARFGSVGALCVVMNLAIMYVGTEIVGINYLLSCLCSFGILTPLSYCLNKNIVFEDRGPGSVAQLLRYVAGLLVNAIINLGFLAVLVDVFDLNYLFAAIISTGMAFLCNYFYQASGVFFRAS